MKQNHFTLIALGLIVTTLLLVFTLSPQPQDGTNTPQNSAQLIREYSPRVGPEQADRKSTRLNSSHVALPRMPSSA